MKQLLIEGLTGAGKSTIVEALKAMLPNDDWQIIYEADTLGEVMSELDAPSSNYDKCFRLRRVLEQLNGTSDKRFLLERFHPSYYALMPDWSLFKEMDQHLAEKDFLLVLLHYDESLFEERAIRRAEMKNPVGTNNAIDYWGSLQAAITAYKNSQDRRFECLELTRMNYIKINTSEMKWTQYADEIMRHF